ncbi:TniQ family protein [Caballeronia sp. EK]|nr:TniQ family protein [Caballeronia sp. EK]MBC8641243.1 TniQ family protein [Caballeronia sp. EK]
MPLHELKFPILTIDESSLSPALGYLFQKRWVYPHESLVSILWKFERANALSGAMVARFMGPDIDPYEGVAPYRDLIDLHHLCEHLRLPADIVRMAVIDRMGKQRYSDVFRFCRRCLSHGYHSVLHQLESITRCPGHRTVLESVCRRCSHQAAYRICAQSLEARYRCANCFAPYCQAGWTPENHRQLKPRLRSKFTRCFLERCRG